MSASGIPWNWNGTDEEVGDRYPCDQHSREPYRALVRAVDVRAPASVVFRWLCQLKVAPYSYDWIDFPGGRSPRKLTPGAENLALGQSFLIGKLVCYETDRHVTVASGRVTDLVFGPLALSYVVKPIGEEQCRLVVAINLTAVSLLGRLRRYLLAWGDLVMMRKQLLTLRDLAEGMHAEGSAPSPVGRDGDAVNQ